MRFSIRGSGTERTDAGGDGEHRSGGATLEPNGGGPAATDGAALETLGPAVGEVEVVREGGEVAASGSPWVLVARTFAQNKLAIAGLVIIVVMVLFSFIGPLIYHTDQLNPNLSNVNLSPGGAYPLGTDASG